MSFSLLHDALIVPSFHPPLTSFMISWNTDLIHWGIAAILKPWGQELTWWTWQGRNTKLRFFRLLVMWDKESLQCLCCCFESCFFMSNTFLTHNSIIASSFKCSVNISYCCFTCVSFQNHNHLCHADYCPQFRIDGRQIASQGGLKVSVIQVVLMTTIYSELTQF